MQFTELLKLAISDGVPKRSLIIAIIVGSLLTIINQGDRIFNGKQPVWWKLVLTYCVPYIVATYGAVTAKLSQKKNQENQVIQIQNSLPKQKERSNKVDLELVPERRQIDSSSSSYGRDLTTDEATAFHQINLD
eukprot:TRINITY_DN40949_c0_g2_i1.p4 TRINITY_DN40949_c0_g2~~TRINITY_DN40949_c0_g2_i1.p4  ORF type:complete len:134 (-),score=10.40 TRINITY_DN40949_c0_g2_i1:1041-1442(-)